MEPFAKVNATDKKFSLSGQDWIIVESSDMANYPNIRKTFDTNGIEAKLIIKRPNGKNLYSTPLFKTGYVYQTRIVKL